MLRKTGRPYYYLRRAHAFFGHPKVPKKDNAQVMVPHKKPVFMELGEGSRLLGYFPTNWATKREMLAFHGARTTGKHISNPGRLSAISDFLRRHKDEILVYADIGAANSAGAPTTYDARAALGLGAKVIAVDVFKSRAGNLHLLRC